MSANPGTILWQGRPKQGLIIGPIEVLGCLAASYFIYPFVLLVPKVFVGSNWMYTPLLLVLLYIAYEVSVGVVIRDKRRRETTSYEITEDRVIVRRKPNFFIDAVASISIHRIGTLAVQEHYDTTATLYLFHQNEPTARRRWKPFLWKYLPPNAGMRDFGMAIVLERLSDWEQARDLVESLRSRHYNPPSAVILGQQK